MTKDLTQGNLIKNIITGGKMLIDKLNQILNSEDE